MTVNLAESDLADAELAHDVSNAEPHAVSTEPACAPNACSDSLKPITRKVGVCQ